MDDGVLRRHATGDRLPMTGFYAFGFPRFLRIESPRISMSVNENQRSVHRQCGIAYLFVPPRDRQLRG